MEISFSPNEILVNIASFLTLKDAKSLLLSSKLMCEISKTCIRTAPRLKRMECPVVADVGTFLSGFLN